MRRKRFGVQKSFLFSRDLDEKLKELCDFFELSEGELVRALVKERYEVYKKGVGGKGDLS